VKLFVGLVGLSMLLATCGDTTDAPRISAARIGQPAGPNAALYLDIDGYGVPDRLIGASSDAAQRIDPHRTVTRDDGTTGMELVPSLDLPASGQLVLEPGGLHLMLIGVDRLSVGDEVTVTLTWETAGETTFTAEVVKPSDTVEGDK